MIWDIVFIISSFLIGSIPFGKIVASLKGVDITKEGSGNIGATNVFRVVGKGWGILVLVLDALKGAIPTLASSYIYHSKLLNFFLPEAYVFIGIASILGHIFSPFVGFKGGKGVATSLGVFAVLTPVGVLIGAVVFGIFIAIFRIVSISSIASTIAVFSFLLVYHILNNSIANNYVLIASAFVVMVFIIIKHSSNIKRLLKGEEKKII
ncbi:MAG: glycerol-3-phosphate 1-O-acyltransferase PlsY [Spirochaetia bacterium]|nr:glycerol-3-phosphate 1-O-acyltransferase PlsY [Spirochaetota bacterium]MCX8097213.1 glycerol-3-phosphate 1-O-acyltransferase PlsY [Spirochaetota bacterium]MDW8111967.1 glycerol-3-phosphate 1-O-acyltransferase PlsY [Spirochaetia bacterium]